MGEIPWGMVQQLHSPLASWRHSSQVPCIPNGMSLQSVPLGYYISKERFNRVMSEERL